MAVLKNFNKKGEDIFGAFPRLNSDLVDIVIMSVSPEEIVRKLRGAADEIEQWNQSRRKE